MTDNPMRLRWYTIVIDCRDHRAQAAWWAQALGWKTVMESDTEAVNLPAGMSMEPPSAEEWADLGPGMVFLPVPESKSVKNRLHMDLAPHSSDDRDAQIERLLSLGATYADVGQDADDVTFTVLADPEGNEFCVLSARER